MKLGRRLMLGHTAMLLLGLLMIAGWTYYEMLVENRVSDFEQGLAAKGNTLFEEAAEVLAGSRGIHVELTDAEPITLVGDSHRLRQLLLIVLDNPLKYNEPGGQVSLALNRQPDAVEISCANRRFSRRFAHGCPP